MLRAPPDLTQPRGISLPGHCPAAFRGPTMALGREGPFRVQKETKVLGPLSYLPCLQGPATGSREGLEAAELCKDMGGGPAIT